MSESFRSVRPAPDEYAPYYSTYIARVPEGDVVEILKRQLPETLTVLRSIPESRGDHRYAPEKWSIKEVVGHLSDAERVFAYRAMRFSRSDGTPVPGFDENLYVANSTFSKRSLEDLVAEFEHVRLSSIHLFGGMDAEAMTKRGTANAHEVSVRAIAYIAAGHETHHLQVLHDRYLGR